MTFDRVSELLRAGSDAVDPLVRAATIAEVGVELVRVQWDASCLEEFVAAARRELARAAA